MMKNIDKFNMFIPTVVMGILAIVLLPGGPYVSLPLLCAGFMRSGASIGTMVAFL
ncbi:MAG: hypothetical protein ABH815_01870 [Candidatus Omnitrophota bacterium]